MLMCRSKSIFHCRWIFLISMLFSVVLPWSRDHWQTDVLERSRQSRPVRLFGGNWFLELEEPTIWYYGTYSFVVLVLEISVTRARDKPVSMFVSNKLGRPNNTISRLVKSKWLRMQARVLLNVPYWDLFSHTKQESTTKRLSTGRDHGVWRQGSH